MPLLEDMEGLSHHRQKSLLDCAIENFGELPEKVSVSEEQALLGYIQCLASVDAGLQKYRRDSDGWSSKQFRTETHDSSKLATNLERNGKPCPIPRIKGRPAEAPNRIEAHHIVPGGDFRFDKAPLLRARLARAKIRINDPDNGAWLPKTPRDKIPQHPNAVPHRRIHREGYYRFLMGVLSTERNKIMFRVKLDLIGKMLQSGDTPDWMMLPKHELPDE
ncbi:AHH domain-containing protein [uncultured Microbulbifer sp.]|uniref:AHH domain-containing protein n=1 Tax=uncultured Microbulbifer sp. TaxID=348147 RepID=UPI0026381E3F|nr:AHH domain-containing protein [uncultured Microbulbifer sp.]